MVILALQFSWSNNNGTDWSGPVRLISGINPSTQVSDSGVINIVYYLSGVYFINSTDQGSTWSSPVAIDESRGSPPLLVIDNNGYFNVVWNSSNKIFSFSRSIDAGATWLTPMDLPESPFSPHWTGHKIVAGLNGILYVSWSAEDNDGNSNVYFTRSNSAQ